MQRPRRAVIANFHVPALAVGGARHLCVVYVQRGRAFILKPARGDMKAGGSKGMQGGARRTREGRHPAWQCSHAHPQQRRRRPWLLPGGAAQRGQPRRRGAEAACAWAIRGRGKVKGCAHMERGLSCGAGARARPPAHPCPSIAQVRMAAPRSAISSAIDGCGAVNAAGAARCQLCLGACMQRARCTPPGARGEGAAARARDQLGSAIKRARARARASNSGAAGVRFMMRVGSPSCACSGFTVLGSARWLKDGSTRLVSPTHICAAPPGCGQGGRGREVAHESGAL